MSKLACIKAIHTIIWIFFNAVLGYLLYAVIKNKTETLVWVAICFIVLEGMVLAVFKGVCRLLSLPANILMQNKITLIFISRIGWRSTIN